MSFEVLLEFRGSRLPLSVTRETALDVLQEASKVRIAMHAEQQSEVPMFILQRFSTKWTNFVDVQDVSEIQEGDRLTLALRVSHS